jgi:hypothetical protein
LKAGVEICSQATELSGHANEKIVRREAESAPSRLTVTRTTQSQNTTCSGEAEPNQCAMNARACSIPYVESVGSPIDNVMLSSQGFSELTMMAAKVSITPASEAIDKAKITKCSGRE